MNPLYNWYHNLWIHSIIDTTTFESTLSLIPQPLNPLYNWYHYLSKSRGGLASQVSCFTFQTGKLILKPRPTTWAGFSLVIHKGIILCGAMVYMYMPVIKWQTLADLGSGTKQIVVCVCAYRHWTVQICYTSCKSNPHTLHGSSNLLYLVARVVWTFGRYLFWITTTLQESIWNGIHLIHLF